MSKDDYQERFYRDLAKRQKRADLIWLLSIGICGVSLLFYTLLLRYVP